MKTRISIEKFCEYTGFDYIEDMWDNVYNYEYENMSIDEILSNLPKKYAVTEQDLKENQELKDALDDAINHANEDSLMSSLSKSEALPTVESDILACGLLPYKPMLALLP